MKRLAVYTAIFGAKDCFKEPASGDFDFVLFTDAPPPSTRVIVKRYPLLVSHDPIRSARMVKALSHDFLPEYEYTVWVDGSFAVLADVAPLVEQVLKDADLAVHPHPDRDCAYAEAKTVLEYRLDDPDIVASQMAAYRAAGYPDRHGLVATGILFRRNKSPLVASFNEEWWREIVRHSRRDQLSFNYVAWKTGLRYGRLDGNLYSSPCFQWRGH